MILCIVGSTSLKGNKEAERIIEEVLAKYNPSLVISGAADGIDTMAIDAAKQKGISFKEYPPKIKRWHDGFMPRNLKMAQDCDALVRIVSSESKTYGSGWTRDRAKEMGKPTEEFIIKV